MPKPKRGEWVYARAAAYSGPDGTNTFEVVQQGGAYLFLFPFDIYTKELTATLTKTTGSKTWRTYPPFLNDAFDPLAIDQIQKELVPGPAAYPEPGLGTPAFENISLSHSIGDRTNAVRIDFVPDPEAKAATEFVERFISWLRALSSQWWIGRNRAYALRPLRNWFGISEGGERASGFHTFWSYYGGFGVERPVTHQEYGTAFRAAANGHQVPLSVDAILDAMHHHASQDDRRSVLDAAIACEAGIGEELRRVAARDGHSASAVKKATSSHDFTDQLEAAEVLVAADQSFASAHPTELSWLKQLRTARGNVAHGEPLRIAADDGSGREPNVEELFAMIDAARVLLGCMQKW